jgi:hypothetical protein
VKGGDCEEEKDVGALPSVRISTVLNSTAGPVELENVDLRILGSDDDAAAALPHAVAPVGAPSMYSCGGAEERKGCDDDAAATYAHAVAPVESAERGGGGALRRVARL